MCIHFNHTEEEIAHTMQVWDMTREEAIVYLDYETEQSDRRIFEDERADDEYDEEY